MSLLTQTGLKTQTGLLSQTGLRSQTSALVQTGLLKTSSPPPYTTGAVSADLGTTWAYGQQPPAWVIALKAPSGALPMIAANWKTTSYWAQGVTSGLGTSPLFIEDSTDWGHFDPAVDVVLGSGLGNPVSGGPADGGEPVLAATYAAVFSAAGVTLVRWISGAAAVSPDTLDIHLGIEWADYPGYDTDYFASVVLNYGQHTDTQPTELTGDGGSTSSPTPFMTTSGNHKNAYLFTPTVCAISIDGGANINAPNAVFTPSTPPTTIALQAGNQQAGTFSSTVRGFVTIDAFYAPQPAGDLPTLSTP